MGSTARRTAVGIVAVAVTAGFAPSAEGRAARARTAVAAAPIAHAAVAISHCGNNGCTETNQLTMAANGGLGVSMTDNIPATATEASVTISPSCPVASDRRSRLAACDPSFSGLLDSFVAGVPALGQLTPGKPETRLMGCVFVAFAAKIQVGSLLGSGFQERANSISVTLFLTCVQMLADEQAKAAGARASRARSAAARCGRLAQSLRVRFSKAGGKVAAQSLGSPMTSKSRSPVSIVCKRSGAGLVVTLKPTRRGQTLPKVIGPTVGIGYVNPGPLPAAVKTTFKVN